MAGNLTMEEREMLLTLTPADVMSVYSGKAGHCCCGCSGKHRYSSQHRAAGSKHRGYTVDDDEVNDVQVRKVLGVVQKNVDAADYGKNLFTVELNERVYIAYLLRAAR